MDLYLPDDFVPHADYSWSEHATRESAEVPHPDSNDDWFGAEAFVAPTLCQDLRALPRRRESDWRTL